MRWSTTPRSRRRPKAASGCPRSTPRRTSGSTCSRSISSRRSCWRADWSTNSKAAKGSVVNVTSIAGSRVHPFAGAAYSTSKAALAALTREMAADFGPLGIRVNAIAPGEIDTAMLSPGTETIIPHIPLHRLGTTDEVAKIIYVLCTETGVLRERRRDPHQRRPARLDALIRSIVARPNSNFQTAGIAYSQRSAAPFERRGVRLHSLPLHKLRERSAERRFFNSRLAAGLRGPPHGGVHAPRGASASRRSTRGICRRRAHVGPAISPGPRFWTGIRPCPVQRAPRGAPLSGARAVPGAARVRGYEPRPQGPHLAPPSDVSRRRPRRARQCLDPIAQ